MTDPVAVIASVSSTIVAGGVIAPFVWRRYGQGVAERHAKDLFLDGSLAIPGVRNKIDPAAVRLAGVETGVAELRVVVDEHGEIMADIQKSLRMSNGQTIGQAIEIAAREARAAATAIAEMDKKPPARRRSTTGGKA
jgi:hypothetical protein